MDKERIFFLVSESRIVDYGSNPDDEEMLDSAKDAICLGDRTLKIIEVDVSVGLPESPDENSVVIEFGNEADIINDDKLKDAFDKHRLDLQKKVWDSMPGGVYRLKKERRGGKRNMLSVEYCPDIKDEEWEQVENTGWKR